ncbi:MAG: carotenoid 1,2-hydratase [Deltaproteobacteria bacterium]|nr:carotenoid 1,2-hydratase [Deltaproteobacteria bacterium]
MKVVCGILLGVFLGLFSPGFILGQDPAGKEFRPALPGWQYKFPADHGAHKAFKTEWWYYNGHLQDARGGAFGYQLTFFRVGLTREKPDPQGSRWRATEVYLAHLAITDREGKSFQFREKAGRGNLGLAGADTGRYRVWIDRWQVEERQGLQILTAGDRSLGVQLTLAPTAPPIIHGFQGISRKGEGIGRASHYYSMTRLRTKGQIRIQGKTREVAGLSWMDHEFGSNQLHPQQLGWDWFSLQLTEPLELMLYQLRREDGRTDPHSSGTLVLPDRHPRPLGLSDFSIRVFQYWKSPNSGARYPSGWEISLPEQQLFLQVRPWVADQELLTAKSTRITYWEGAVTVTGTWRGRPVQGSGYVEMTGYDRRFPPKI